MKKGILITGLLVGLLTLVLTSVPSWAEEEVPTASADIAILSDYIWRGYAFSNDSIVIQPSATIGYKGYSFNLWGNLDTELDDGISATDDTSQFNETDMTFSYDTDFGKWSIGVGYIYYGLDGALDTQEIYLSMGYDTFLSPSLTIYRDIDTFPGTYVNLSIGHSIKLSKDLNLDLSGSVGYYSSDDDSVLEIDDTLTATNKKYSAFHDAVISASVTYPINQFITITPTLSYSFPLSDAADNIITANSVGLFGENDSDFFYGGVLFSFAF